MLPVSDYPLLLGNQFLNQFTAKEILNKFLKTSIIKFSLTLKNGTDQAKFYVIKNEYIMYSEMYGNNYNEIRVYKNSN